jgi:succinyl-diaminopimelate desuccinylase
VLSGHFDTVPLGNKKWTKDPFNGEISDGKLWGRGSSDMKGGLAAMILSAINAFENSSPKGGVKLIFTAGEELGCQGVQQLVQATGNMGMASAIIVGEPTANKPATGHKGALYLNAVTKGLTAHSSMPELGINAIYKAAASIMKLMDFKFNVDPDPLLGSPTFNVGKISGGMNINSVPDHAEFTIDVRTTTKSDHNTILKNLKEVLGGDISLETLVNLGPVYTDESNQFTQLIYNICGVDRPDRSYPKALPYLTDGSILQRIYNGVPTIILGPGQPEMAHQTDEFCYTDKLEESVIIYTNIIKEWRS